MGAVALEVFGPSKPGFVIVVLVFLAVGGWLAEMVTGAIGNGRTAAKIKTGVEIASILTIVAIFWKLLNIFFNFTQGKM